MRLFPLAWPYYSTVAPQNTTALSEDSADELQRLRRLAAPVIAAFDYAARSAYGDASGIGSLLSVENDRSRGLSSRQGEGNPGERKEISDFFHFYVLSFG
jgi:hypothetical protein